LCNCNFSNNNKKNDDNNKCLVFRYSHYMAHTTAL
jgi:hypothetical protein